MKVRKILHSRIEAYCARHELTERAFGYIVVQDGRLVPRLRDGVATLKVIERVEAFLDANKAPPRIVQRRSAPAERAA